MNSGRRVVLFPDRLLAQRDANPLPVRDRRTEQSTSKSDRILVQPGDRASRNDEAISDQRRGNQKSQEWIEMSKTYAPAV